ncbi:nucleotidyltransferase [Bacillus weihaiensis]|uniref:tRNA(Met) cytidine acetate ligase n=1 Tax=Bacillus weihaiensis TaxID=1547283 RepID=A0A1L3MSQ2_9BACI|nr:nucleotidyltransferase [Bacillus weihaiensis]APH05363.1 hypothetical protein A9C19_11710 [Bacillus weihaiensis]
MNVVGIVVEYNPFHNGHLFHLQESIKETDADIVIAVMSGNFLQRGEPAITSKWNRTKMALASGVDLVIELPYVFATQKAETFANGAISILNALKCNTLCFGSELGVIDPFVATNEFLLEKKQEYDQLIKKYVKTGVSYPTAMTLAFKELTEGKALLDLSLPNNILGFHYVKSIALQKAAITPHTIKRTSANYHDEDFSSPTIASATSIRKAIFSNESIHNITSYIPPCTVEGLNHYIQENSILHHWEEYFQLLKYTVMTMTLEELRFIYEMEEGLEYRMKKFIGESTNFKEFLEKVKTKRYTWTRLQRVCTHILTRTTKLQLKHMNSNETSPYIRLLGMSKSGQNYLRSIKKHVPLPIVSKLSSFKHPFIEVDIKASFTYNMIFQEPNRSYLIKQEFAQTPITV